MTPDIWSMTPLLSLMHRMTPVSKFLLKTLCKWPQMAYIWQQTVICGHLQSFVVACAVVVCGSLRSFVVIYICHLRSFAGACHYLGSFAVIWEHLCMPFKVVSGHLWSFWVICGHLRSFAVIYTCHLRLFVVISGCLRSFAVFCGHLRQGSIKCQRSNECASEAPQ